MIQAIHPTPTPKANPAAMVYEGNARFTILTSRLIRLEFDPQKRFEDHASQVFLYRDQCVPEFQSWKQDGWLHIETEYLHLQFVENGRFHWRDLHISLKQTDQTWQYSNPDHSNLGGTIRTLDSTNGRLSFPDGLVSRSGWAVVDDSHSLIFDQDEWLQPRELTPEKRDLYFFGYAQDYLSAITDYQLISGKPGLLPRWALGNWWSRYWAYSDQELLDLMDTFIQHQIPLSVCIVDMDWHITKTGNTSSGWTGYTWNRNLFPEPEQFIDALHKRDLKTALNLHPAEGVHPHEEAYPAMASALGQDPAEGKPIPFDIAHPAFTEAYFKFLHHPMEEQGVDFWWMDWQQGTQSKTAGLDPLFWLNHLHYYDLGRTTERRPFIFSRWPGLGGHRYPIGFSGDTIVSWESLAFQPEMTATAANVAYGWWSHDIGGHCEGVEDPELYLRWVQFGIFSPIFRLHCTNNDFIDRRPWGFGKDILEHARAALQLRHSLLPLIYTANWLNSEHGEPLILPMYYSYPNEEAAYQAPNQYTFSRQLIVAPITQPADPSTNLSRASIWLPAGQWFDIFTNEAFEGGQWLTLHADQSQIPVFAKAGAIIPLDAEGPSNGVRLPSRLLIKFFAGENGTYQLSEDDGETQSYQHGNFALTTFWHSLSGDTIELGKSIVEGQPGVIPGFPMVRNYTFEIIGISQPTGINIVGTEVELAFESSYDEASKSLIIRVDNVPASKALLIRLTGIKLEPFITTPITRLHRLMKFFRLSTLAKGLFMQKLPLVLTNPPAIFEISHHFTKPQFLAIYEGIVPTSEIKPMQDANSAFEMVMEKMRKYMSRSEN
ncbi:MAG TPA: glycoside hydrolase family 31 protein [Anaerolineaceae bacterium]|nr:glycoside hydrolase family 31 protein [Anaerolineaceae bacterium]